MTDPIDQTGNNPQLQNREVTRYKLLIAFLLLLYFIAGLSTEFLLPDREKDFPPFFSWFLFDRVPNKTNTEYTLRIVEYAGKKIDPPVLYEQATGIVDNPNSPKSRSLIRRLGYAVERNRDESIHLRQLLEQVYLPSSIKYQIVIVSYNPIKRFSEGDAEIKVIGEFYKY